MPKRVLKPNCPTLNQILIDFVPSKFLNFPKKSIKKNISELSKILKWQPINRNSPDANLPHSPIYPCFHCDSDSESFLSSPEHDISPFTSPLLVFEPDGSAGQSRLANEGVSFEILSEEGIRQKLRENLLFQLNFKRNSFV